MCGYFNALTIALYSTMVLSLFSGLFIIIMELTIYAIIAFFIFSRLYNAFGKSSQTTKSQLVRIQDEKRVNEEIPEDDIIEEDKFKYVGGENLSEIGSVAEKIKAKEPRFSTDRFIEGAERAFEMVLSSYSKGDLKEIKALLSKSLFDNLLAKVEERKNSGQTLENIIIAINSRELTKLDFTGSTINATVKFVSEQSNVVKDASGNIISGDHNKTEIVEDILEFKRTAGSSSPRWLLHDMR